MKEQFLRLNKITIMSTRVMDLLKCVPSWFLDYYLPTRQFNSRLPLEVLEVYNYKNYFFISFKTFNCLYPLLNIASDFTVSSQTQVFPAGSSAGERRCINIPINDDVLVELLESFSVSLSSTDPNVEFSPGGTQATVTITDNDGKR